MNLLDYFDKSAAAHADRVCAKDAIASRTYRDVQLASFRLANVLRDLGVDPQTRVAILSENTAAAFECVVGVLRAGCTWVPIGTNQSVDATIAMLDGTDTQVMLYSRRHAKKAHDAIARCRSLRHTICVDHEDGYSPALQSLLVEAAEADPRIEPSPNDVVTLLSSGGTTGKPKGVMMTNRCWEMVIASFMVRYQHDHAVHLVAAPITHAAGGAALALCALGFTNVLIDGFEPTKVLSAIERHRVTLLGLTPTAIRLLVKHPSAREHDYASLRFFIYAGAPMPIETIKEAIDVFGPVMTTAFGQTETGHDVTFMSPIDLATAHAGGDDVRLRSCGRPTPFVRVEVMSDRGELLGPNEIGEIVVRGDQLMTGYYNDAAETARASRGGWHHTGDLGYRDRDGLFYLVDRKRDVIIRGGFNVFPSEIEAVIRQHAAVRDCAVVGLPDDDWGEVPAAVVEADSAALDVGELQALCRSKLALLQLPRSFEIWPELPRGQAGKVSRSLVRERLVAGMPAAPREGHWPVNRTT
ncbi:MAG TPA: AMP-binding protein [Gammaproteobacteria bacterium]|nr:AMP-binding protein [Gammaproteobacteria bacterium]